MDMEEAEQEQGKHDAAGRLTYEIFSMLESRFLFGSGGGVIPQAQAQPSFFQASLSRPGFFQASSSATGGKVCVLSIDGGARPVDGLLAAAALVRLEAALRRRNKDDDARLADFFDVAAGSGAGGVLAAMLFARGPSGRPVYSADDALAFLLRRVQRRGWSSSARSGLLLRATRRHRAAAGDFGRVFGELTLRDTVRPVLVPCYDRATRAPFLFSRAAAADSPAHDFLLRDVCAAATCAAAVEVVSVDGATRISAVGGGGGGGVALGNPTAAAITHVLNNRREFPAAATMDDLLVMSIGTGETAAAAAEYKAVLGRSKPPEIARIAAEGVSDMVDQAVAMAFGLSRTSNYVRIQGTGSRRADGGRAPRTAACGGETKQQAVWKAEAMLLQKSVESVLFQGRKLAGETNAEKLERFARELAKEHGRRTRQQPAANPGAGIQQLVPAPAAPIKQQTTAAAAHTNAVATSSASAATATEDTTAAAQAPPPRRRHQRTSVRTTTVAATKRAPKTSSWSSSSKSKGARRITL